MGGFRKVCITKNNYTDVIYAEYVKHITENAIYGIIGKEVGKSGTPHLQMYVEYKNARRFATLCNIYKGAHIEKKRASNVEASDYCKKDGKYLEIGTFTAEHQGERNDLKNLAESIEDNNNIRQLIEDNIATSNQHLQMTQKLMTLYEPPRDGKPEVYWYFGKSGTGKTKQAHEQCSSRPWVSKGNLDWFDGYDGHEDVILDDFRPDHVPFSTLLRLLDRYEFSVPIKGGFRQWKPKRIFITTPKSITETYIYANEEIRQLSRRVDWERCFLPDT